MKIELNIYEIKYLTMMLEDTFTEEEITPILIQDLYSKLVVLKKKTPLMGKKRSQWLPVYFITKWRLYTGEI